jgi:hypothetical protein
MALGGMLLSSLFAFLGTTTEAPARVLICFSLAFAVLGMCEGVFWTTVTGLGGRSAGLAAAFLNTLGNAGGTVAPWLTAVLSQRYDWTTAIVTACAINVAGGLLWTFFDPAGPRTDSRQSA